MVRKVPGDMIETAFKDKTIRKDLSSTVETDSIITSFGRSDLTIGKYYEVHIRMRFLTSGTNTPNLTLYNGTVDIGIVSVDINPASAMVGDASNTFHFTATSTELSVLAGNTSSTHYILGNTVMIIEERNSSFLVDSFT